MDFIKNVKRSTSKNTLIYRQCAKSNHLLVVCYHPLNSLTNQIWEIVGFPQEVTYTNGFKPIPLEEYLTISIKRAFVNRSTTLLQDLTYTMVITPPEISYLI